MFSTSEAPQCLVFSPKPIIDIAAAMQSPIDQNDVVRRLSRAGCVFRGDMGAEGGLLFARTDENDVPTVHVRVVRADSTPAPASSRDSADPSSSLALFEILVR
jgi:GrpB protein